MTTASIDHASGTRDKPEVEFVHAVPMWNSTTRTEKLNLPTPVLGRKKQRNSQSGVLLKVRTINGQIKWLDSQWFEEYAD